jgi:hypothetical protein
MTTAEIMEASSRTVNAGPFTVGAQSNTLGDTAKYFKGRVGEMLVFDGILDVKTANDFCVQQAAKWCVNSGSFCRPQPLATLSGDLPQRNKLAYHISTDGDFQDLPLGTEVTQLLDTSPNQKVFNVVSNLCTGAKVAASNGIDRKVLRFGETGPTCYMPVGNYVYHTASDGFGERPVYTRVHFASLILKNAVRAQNTGS